ncbi:MAG TPA: hypothetical protein VGO00_08800, partial [Kofleriaceae bacterium]|nr:hypothetical protein [Kofleriaceae bacterium]
LKLRNNPDMVLGQQRDALEAAGGARHQRADVRKGQDIPEAMQDHLDDPRARKALEDPSNYGPGTGGGIEATKMVDQSLHKQLEATTGVKYDVITNDSLSYDTPGQGEFGHHQVPHDRIVAALDAGLPVLIGMMGHANVIVGHSTGSDGKEMYILSDPMSGKTSKLPADLLDVVMVQSLTIPHVEPKPAVTPEIGANKPVVENKSVPPPRGDEMADETTRAGGAPDPVADPKLVELATKAREKYGPVLDDAIVTLDAMVGDLGHVEGRAKDPVSAANRLQRAIDKFGAKVTDVDSAIDNLWDAIGTRIVVDHPTPDVMSKVVARLVDAINAGKLKVSMANNLHGEGGLPYMTPE